MYSFKCISEVVEFVSKALEKGNICKNVPDLFRLALPDPSVQVGSYYLDDGIDS